MNKLLVSVNGRCSVCRGDFAPGDAITVVTDVGRGEHRKLTRVHVCRDCVRDVLEAGEVLTDWWRYMGAEGKRGVPWYAAPGFHRRVVPL